MRTWTEIHREGELLGPVDWSYDFTQHDWGRGNCGGVNPESTAAATEMLKQAERALLAGKRVTCRCYGLNHTLVAVGMYDGWPFWKPVPSICVSTRMGSEWHPWYCVAGIKVESQEANT